MLVENKGRGLYVIHSLAVLAFYLLLSVIGTAFIVSCDPFDDVTEHVQYPEQEEMETPETKIALQAKNDVRCADVFFFNDDRQRRLDSYQRFQGESIANVSASSRKGRRIMVVIANSTKAQEEWYSISSYYDLAVRYSELSAEETSYPILIGEKKLTTGKDKSVSVTLTVLMSVVRLNSISCDFHLRPYKDAILQNVRAYLTNVNVRYPFIAESGVYPASEMLNLGHFSEQDMTAFGHPEMVCSLLSQDIGSSVVRPDIELFCYPNVSETASLGSPFTKLVIEGSLMGETYYYPIDINRDEDGQGVNANTVYSYDITITGRGSTDPDTPAEREYITAVFSTSEWEDTDVVTIKY